LIVYRNLHKSNFNLHETTFTQQNLSKSVCKREEITEISAGKNKALIFIRTVFDKAGNFCLLRIKNCLFSYRTNSEKVYVNF